MCIDFQSNDELIRVRRVEVCLCDKDILTKVHKLCVFIGTQGDTQESRILILIPQLVV